DGQWHELDWETALDRVAERISDLQARHGKNALGVYLGNPNVHNLGGTLLNGGFLRALKTRNKFSATSVDQLPHHIVAWKLFGHQLRIPVPDIDRSDYFVIMGGNPLASNGSIMSVADVRGRLKAVKKRGKVVVIDPRRSQTAELADQHHFIRPGSDVLLLLAMLNHLFQSQQISLKACEGLLDTDPMTLASDFAPYTPERVAESTGISAAAIRQLVDEFCAAEAPVLYGRMGVSVQEFGALCQYLIMLFNILTGTLDKAGGLMFSTPAANILPQTGRGNMGRFHSRVR
ncbi:molybdopterin-dependent oxidoreductase, partial [Spongiibacter tropicus]